MVNCEHVWRDVRVQPLPSFPARLVVRQKCLLCTAHRFLSPEAYLARSFQEFVIDRALSSCQSAAKP